MVRSIVNGVANPTQLGVISTVGTKGTVILGNYQATLNGVSHTWNDVVWDNPNLVPGWVVVDVLGPVPPIAPTVTLTLYVHSGSAGGPLLSGALVTGSDGAGKTFSQTTGAGGYVTITGTAGTWQFTASKAGYNANSWNQSITATGQKDAFLSQSGVTLTLYVHDGSATGPLLSGVRVTGTDGAGQAFDQTTGTGGFVTITGPAGTWQFNASKAGYSANSWNQSITATGQKDAFLSQSGVTLTLYVHDGSATGPLLSGVRVTGTDGAGQAFDQTTGTGGFVTITGAPGTWQFNASKAGYNGNSWNQSITATGQKDAFLTRSGVTLTLYVHDGSATGPLLSGVRVTGTDGAGQAFDQTTGTGGFVTITGAAGTWQLNASKAGYNGNSWNQSITATGQKDAFLSQSGVTLTVTSPAGGENWTAGTAHSVTWTVSGSTASVAYYKIALSTDGGTADADFTTQLTPNGLWTPSQTSWAWTIPASLSTAQGRIRVRAMDGSGNLLAQAFSAANFTISGPLPTITVTSPAAGRTGRRGRPIPSRGPSRAARPAWLTTRLR